jgi:hypothetical protein
MDAGLGIVVEKAKRARVSADDFTDSNRLPEKIRTKRLISNGCVGDITLANFLNGFEC